MGTKHFLYSVICWLITVSLFAHTNWDSLKGLHLKLKKYGAYNNGKEVNIFVPSVANHNSEEYIMLRVDGVLIWGNNDNGTQSYRYRISGDYCFFDKQFQQAWFRIISCSGNSFLTIDNLNTYRYFQISDEDLPRWSKTLPQSAINDSPVFCGGSVNDLLHVIEDNTYSQATPMGRHFEKCPVANESQKKWLENATAEPKGVNEFTYWSAQVIDLYPYGKPYPVDVNQTLIGDCNTASILAEIAYLYPDFIKSIIKKDTETSYSVKMFDPKGDRIVVRVSNKTLCDKKGNIVQLTGKGGVLTWSMILEKAIMKWLQVYKPNISLWGFGAEHATPLFTGDGRSFAIYPGKLKREDYQRMVITCLQNGLIVNGGFNKSGMKIDNHESVAFHGHSFLLPPSSDYLFCMRNPWGHGSDDNVMRISKNASYLHTMDLRIISPGAAAPYFVRDLAPYVTPQY